MQTTRAYSDIVTKLRDAGLRPTRQRLALGKLLFAKGDRHVTADQLQNEATRAKVPVSLATIYNTLNQFTEAGLLREVVLAPGRSFFDTNIEDHHHLYFEEEDRLEDIPANKINIDKLPPAPAGHDVTRVDVVMRVAPRGSRS